jgi:hypothetical protein
LTNEDCILEHHCTKCIEKDQNGLEDCHLERECSNDEKVVTKKQEIKICNPILDKVCPKNPCKTCPMFCRPNKQIWCEDDFQVLERIVVDKSCSPATNYCSIVERKFEYSAPGRRCYEKNLGPLCATIDCKFQPRGEGEECVYTARTINLTLRQEECKSCQKLAPLQNKSEICTTQLGRPCAPGHQGRWVKKCEGKIREPRQHDQENKILPIRELFDMAAGPVRKLLNPLLLNDQIMALSNRDHYDEDDFETTTTSMSGKKTPFSMKNLIILNQRSMLVANDETDSDSMSENDDVDGNNVVIITGTIGPNNPRYLVKKQD